MISYATPNKIRILEILEAFKQSPHEFFLIGSTALGNDDPGDLDFAVRTAAGVEDFLLSLGFKPIHMEGYLDPVTANVFRHYDTNGTNIDVCLVYNIEKKLSILKFLHDNPVVARMYYRLDKHDRRMFCTELLESFE